MMLTTKETGAALSEKILEKGASMTRKKEKEK